MRGAGPARRPGLRFFEKGLRGEDVNVRGGAERKR